MEERCRGPRGSAEERAGVQRAGGWGRCLAQGAVAEAAPRGRTTGTVTAGVTTRQTETLRRAECLRGDGETSRGSQRDRFPEPLGTG